MAQPIQLTPFDQPQQAPISLNPTESVNISPKTADVRATKAAYGLTPLTGESKKDIEAQLSAGKEQEFRTNAAFKIDKYNEAARVNAVKSLLNQGVNVTPEVLQNYSVGKTNPDTVIEKSFATAYVAPLANPVDPFTADTFMKDAHTEIAQHTASLLQLSQQLIATDQYYKKHLEDLEDTLSQQSTIGFGIDQLKNMFQPYTEWKLRGLTEQASTFAEGMLGSTLKAEGDDINRIPTLEGKQAALEPILERLKKDNPTLALKFMQYVAHSHDTDAAMDNFWTAAMASGVLGGVARKMGLFTKAAKAAADVAHDAKNVGSQVFEDPDIARWENEGGAIPPNVSRPSAMGDIKEAAVQDVINNIEKSTMGTANPVVRAIEQLPSAMKKDLKNFEDPGNHGKELSLRIQQSLKSLYINMLKLGRGDLRVNRWADVTQNPEAVRLVTENMGKMHPELQGHIMNVEGFIHDPFTNSYSVNLILGRNSAEYFGTIGEAQEFASPTMKNIPLTKEELAPFKKVGKYRVMPTLRGREKQLKFGADIIQKGTKFYIAKNVPIDITQPFIKQLYGVTPSSKSPWSFIRAFTSWISTPEDTQSLDLRAAKQVATYGPDKYYELMQHNTNELQKLSKTEANELERVLKGAQQEPDPNNNGIPGKFYQSIFDVDDAWQRYLGHDPSDNQVAAYFQFKHNMEADRWFRTVAKARVKLNVGVQEHIVMAKDEAGQLVRAPAFDGRRLPPEEGFPRGAHSTVLVLKDKLEHSKIYGTDSGEQLTGKSLEEMEERIKKGEAQVIERFDPDEEWEFAGAKTEDRIRYVVVKHIETTPLDLTKQVPRQGAGHLLREHNHYLSQARVIFNRKLGRYVYLGDTNLAGIDIRAMGKKVLERLENIRLLLKENKMDEIRAYHDANPIPYPLEEYLAKFKPTKDVNGKTIRPQLDLKEPIHLRSKDKMLIDISKEALENRYLDKDGKTTLIDGTRQGSLARTATVQFTGERDAYDFYAIQDQGSRFNPLFNLTQSEPIDAIPMMQRALGQIINSHYMDDYKYASMDHWLFGAVVPDPITGKMVGAANFLKASTREIMHSPGYYFNNLEGEWKPDTPIEIKSMLLADRMKIRQFTGTPSVVDSALHSMEQKLSDSIYGKFGPKAMKLAPLWQISALSNVPRIMRSILYNAKMGFFSPRQFLIHAFTFINAALISPRYAGSGAYAAMLHGWSALNASPAFLKHMDALASKFSFPGQIGWKPGEFMEARTALLRTNFQKVESSRLALVDNPMANNIIKNKTSSFLDLGTSPFRGGVKSLKTASWYTAFKEFREAHPTGKLTDHDIGQILNRANDLSHNMSRASTSAVQKGFMTFGAMFSSYNLRLMELLVGKRLSVAERLRLGFGYMTLFGVPTAAGIFGLSTVLRTNVEKGNVPGLETYVPGYDFTITAIMEGLLPALLGKATGGGDIQKGHIYDVGESYGAKDLDIVDSALNGDKSIWDFFGGAAYSTFANTWANSSGFRHAIMSMVRQDGEFKLKPDDFVDLFKEISSVNYAWRGFVALETGKWMSRNEAYLQPVSPGNALFMSITGLADQAVPDVYTKSLTVKERREAEAQAFKEYAKEFQRYLQAINDHNPEQATQFGKRATMLLGFIPIQERGRAITQAYRDNQDLVSRTDFTSAFSREVPDADRARQQEIFSKKQELKTKQGIQ